MSRVNLIATVSTPTAGGRVRGADHGRLRPWRFVVVDSAVLGPLGDAFTAAHAERTSVRAPPTSPASGRSRCAPPMIVVVVGTPREHPKMPVREQRTRPPAPPTA
jgi:hypothetical protein